jgi:hypothetical protein
MDIHSFSGMSFGEAFGCCRILTTSFLYKVQYTSVAQLQLELNTSAIESFVIEFHVINCHY